MFQILAECRHKLLRYLPICLVTTSSCCAINPNALAIFERSVVLSLAELSLVVSFETGGAGAFGLLVGRWCWSLRFIPIDSCLALLGLGRLLVFLFVFALAGVGGAVFGLIIAVRIFLPSLAPADAGRSKSCHTITMASLACEIGKSVRDLLG